MLTENEKKFLLELAKKAIKVYPEAPKGKWKNLTATLMEKRGVFVTLEKGGQLRGCIGFIHAVMPLHDAVIENAVNAAFRDPRFPPVSKKEMKSLKIEISVLSEPVRFKFDSPEQLLKKLNGEGVILKKGHNSATFLPQVWEQIPDKEEFLSELAMKAGLHSDGWKEAEVYLYTVEKFS